MTEDAFQWPTWFLITERVVYWLVVLGGSIALIRWGKKTVEHLNAALRVKDAVIEEKAATIQGKDTVIQDKDAQIAGLQDEVRQWKDRAPAELIADMEAGMKWLVGQRQLFNSRMSLAATVVAQLEKERDAARLDTRGAAIDHERASLDTARVILDMDLLMSAYEFVCKHCLGLVPYQLVRSKLPVTQANSADLYRQLCDLKALDRCS